MEAHVVSDVQKKIKSRPSAGKLMLTVFWDTQWPILEHHLERGTTVTIVKYCDVLRNKLRPAVRTKRRGRLSQGVSLHDNASPRHQRPSATELGSSRAPSPRPKSSAFRFPSAWARQERSERSSICRYGEVKEAKHDWLRNQPQNFFQMALRSL
jgi:hypothetical protein